MSSNDRSYLEIYFSFTNMPRTSLICYVARVARRCFRWGSFGNFKGFCFKSQLEEIRVASEEPDFHVPLPVEKCHACLNKGTPSIKCEHGTKVTFIHESQDSSKKHVDVVAAKYVNKEVGNAIPTNSDTETSSKSNSVEQKEETTVPQIKDQNVASSLLHKPETDTLRNDLKNGLSGENEIAEQYSTVKKLPYKKDFWTEIYEYTGKFENFDLWMTDVNNRLKLFNAIKRKEQYPQLDVGHNIGQSMPDYYGENVFGPNTIGFPTENVGDTIVTKSFSDEEVLVNSSFDHHPQPHEYPSSDASLFKETAIRIVHPKSTDVTAEADALQAVLQGLLIAKHRFDHMFSDILTDSCADNTLHVDREHAVAVESNVHQNDEGLAETVVPDDKSDGLNCSGSGLGECPALADIDARLENMFVNIEESDTDEVPAWTYE